MAERAENALKQLSDDVLRGKEPEPGPYTFFSHNLQALKRVQDVHRVLKRMSSARLSLFQMDLEIERRRPKNWPAGIAYPSDVSDMMKASREINSHLEMDFEALYFYGGILLDQLAALSCHVGGFNRVLWFSGLVQTLEKAHENSTYATVLTPLWEKHKSSILKHYSSFKIFRDKFIVHHELPWQHGTGRDFLSGNFVLNNFLSPGWLSKEQEDEAFSELNQIISLAPALIRENAKNLNWMQLIPMLLEETDKFDSLTRMRIHAVALKYGFSTHTYHEVGERLLTFAADFSEELTAIANSNMENLRIEIKKETKG
jgi:hypothetical protein